MKTYMKVIYGLLVIAFVIYLINPNYDFPEPSPEALQSDEPADTETPLRRAYFTNLDRQQVLYHYQNQIQSAQAGFPLPTYRLNYPPEESRTIIRDQTRSTFLEEIVHPLRESVFVNGFEPKESKDVIFIQGRKWRQKIIIRYVPSSIFIRIFIGLFIIVLVPIIFSFWKSTLSDIKERLGNA